MSNAATIPTFGYGQPTIRQYYDSDFKIKYVKRCKLKHVQMHKYIIQTKYESKEET